jgi:hypothetical protein
VTTTNEYEAVRRDAEHRLAELRPVWQRLRRGDIEDWMVLAELSSVVSQIKAAQAVLEQQSTNAAEWMLQRPGEIFEEWDARISAAFDGEA